MRYFYSIADVCFEIEADIEEALNIGLEDFLTGKRSPDLRFSFEIKDSLPGHADHILLGRTMENSIYSAGNRILRASELISEQGAYSYYPAENADSSLTIFTEKGFRYLNNERYFLNAISFNQLMLQKNVLFLHASFIDHNGKAIVFCAPSGTGKSTQADLWKKYKGAEVINGDKTALRVVDGTLFAYGSPFSGTSGISLKRKVPVAAILLLSQAPQNKAERLYGFSAVEKLTKNIHLDFIAPNERLLTFITLSDILNRVSVYHYECTKEEDAVNDLFDLLKAEGDI